MTFLQSSNISCMYLNGNLPAACFLTIRSFEEICAMESKVKLVFHSWGFYVLQGKGSRKKNKKNSVFVKEAHCYACTHIPCIVSHNHCLLYSLVSKPLPIKQSCTASLNEDVCDRFMTRLYPSGQEKSVSLQPGSHHNSERRQAGAGTAARAA